MNHKMSRAPVLVLLAHLLTLAACGESEPFPSPVVAPGPAAGPGAPATGSLINGAVYDTALRKLAGTKIEVLDGPHAGMATTSNSEGMFALAGTFDADTRFRATKDAHVVATRTFQHVARSKWIFFELEVLAPPVNVAGDYTLTFIADSACVGLPDDVRSRTYSVTIIPGPGTTIPAHLYLNGTVAGASFLERYSDIAVHVAGDYVAIPQLGDLHGDPGLVEEVTTNRYLAFEGSASAASVGPAASTISMSLHGFIDHCVMNSAMGQRYSCDGPTAARVRCTSANHRLVLTRRP